MSLAGWSRGVLPQGLLRSCRGWVLGVPLALMLAGCGSGYFGAVDDEAPIPGRRIAILTLGKGLEPDPTIAGEEIRLIEPQVNPAWAQPGGNARHALYHLALKADPKRAWSADIGDGSDARAKLLAQPLVAGKTVYAMDSRSIVSALDLESGKRLWRQDLEPEEEDDGYFGGGIAFEDGRVYVSTGFAKVFALDAESGERLWEARVPAPVRGAPAVSQGRVFVVTIDNRTLALSAGDGRRLWSHAGIQESASPVGGASPAIAGSAVIVPYSSGEIFALLAETGRVVWSDSLSGTNRLDPMASLAAIRASPVIDRGIVYAVSHAGRMAAIDLRRGLRSWDIELGGIEMPWAAGDYVFVISDDAELVALRRRDGRIRWVAPLPRFDDPEDEEGRIHWYGPVLAGDRLVLAGSHGEAVSVSPYSGEILGLIDLPGPASVAPVVAGERLLFLTSGARLVALH